MALADFNRPIHLRAGEGRRVRVITDLVTVKVATTDTGGAYSMFEVETPPLAGCPPHIQRYDDESFFVLDGRYSFLIGGREVELQPGDVAYVPRGTVHAYVNPGAEAARMLVFATSGGIQERFIDDIGDQADRPPWEPDMDRVLAVAPKYGIEFAMKEVRVDGQVDDT